MNGGQSPLTYKRFQTLISRMDAVELPAESITAEIMGKCSTPLSDDHDDKFGVPSLEELGESSQKTKHDQTETQDYRQSFNVVMFFVGFFNVQVLIPKVCPQLCGRGERPKPSQDLRGIWRGR